RFLSIILLGLTILGGAAAQQAYTLRSPDRKIEVHIRTAGRIAYDVLLNGKVLLQDCTMSIDIDRTILGARSTVKGVKERSVDQVVEPVVHRKSAKIRENYNELRVDTDGGLAVTFRAFNEGVAYRLETALPGDQVKVYDEVVNLHFADNFTVFYPQEES